MPDQAPEQLATAAELELAEEVRKMRIETEELQLHIEESYKDQQIQADELAQLKAYKAENFREAQPELEEPDAPPDSPRSGTLAEEDEATDASTHDLVNAEHIRLREYEHMVATRDTTPTALSAMIPFEFNMNILRVCADMVRCVSAAMRDMR